MNYTLHQLQVFLRVARTGSITRAAEELNLTQPAVSIQLRNFQSQFDIPLTEIVGRKVQITPFGSEIASATEKILHEVDAMQYKTMSHRGMLTGKLRFSIVSTGQYVLPFFLAGFARRFEGIEFSIEVANMSQVMDKLSRREADFCLVSILPPRQRVESLVLMDNEICLIGPPEMPLPKGKLAKETWARFPLIYREEGSGIRASTEAFIEKHNLKFNQRLQLTSNEAVKQAVIAGLGCSMMPMVSVRREVAAGLLRVVPMPGLPIRTPWRLIWPSQRTLQPASQAFLDYIRESREAVVKEWFSNTG